MFAHLAFMVLYLREYSSELHDPSFTGKPRIPPFRGRARDVITTGIRRDMLATLERQHRNSFVADASEGAVTIILPCIVPRLAPK